MAKKKARKVSANIAAPVEAAPIVIPPPVVEIPVAVQKHRSGWVGVWAYIIGIVVAFGAAVFMWNGLDYLTYAVLALLGIIVGLLNITDEEVMLFLVASVSFIVSANGVRIVLNEILFVETFMNGIIIFTAAGAFIVSFKALYRVAKSE